jgi:hypothetical protein
MDAGTYARLSKWWVGHGWTPPPLEILPPAHVVTKYAAGFVYVSHPVAWLEWLVTDPGAPVQARAKGILKVIRDLQTIATTGGAKWCFTSTNRPALVTVFERCGFIVGDRDATQLVKCLLSHQ